MFGFDHYPTEIAPQLIVADEAIGGWEIAPPSALRLDLGESPFLRLPIPLALLISRRLREGAGQRVKDPQPHQRHDIIELVGGAPEEFPQPPVSHRAHSDRLTARPGSRNRLIPPPRQANAPLVGSQSALRQSGPTVPAPRRSTESGPHRAP